MSDEDLLATMYADEEEDARESHAPSTTLARTRLIKVGIIEYEVPTVEYMRFLEATITQQAHILDQYHHALERIQAMLQGTRGHVRRHVAAIDDMRQELSRRAGHL